MPSESNRVYFPKVRVGIYQARKGVNKRGKCIEIAMPALLPKAKHDPRPQLFIYGSYYAIKPNLGKKEGALVMTLVPCKFREGGYKMQEINEGSKETLVTWPKFTKIEFAEKAKYGCDVSDLIARIEAYHLEKLKTEYLFEDMANVYGKKYLYDVFVHPITGYIFIYFPKDLVPYAD